MQLKNLSIALFGVVVGLGFFSLLFDVGGETAADVDESELEKALQRHKRQSLSTPSPRSNPTTPRIPRPKRKKSSKKEVADVSSEEESAVFSGRSAISGEPKGSEADIRARMNEANSFYDRADYEGAIALALEILEQDQKNVRMLRVVVSSSCIMGEPEAAQRYYKLLPSRDQKQMGRRCKRYGVEFEEE